MFLALVLLLALLGTASGQNITVNAEVEYRMKSLTSMEDTFYLRFKNTNEQEIEVLDFFITIPKSENAKIVYVKDLPSGYVKVSDIVGDDGREYTMIQVTKTLTPFEEYQLTIKRELTNPVEVLGDGVYSFKAYEFPSYFRDFGLSVERFTIKLSFPDSIFKNYNILSTSSNTKFVYKSLNRIDGLEWDYVNPPNQIHVYVSFTEVPNFYLFNIIGAGLTIVAFSALFVYTLRLEKRLKKHEVVKNPPWSGDLLAKMKEMIQRAEKEILITSPHIYYTDWLTAELQPLMSRGIKFRIITWPSYRRDVYRSVEEVQEDKKQYFTLKRFLEMFPPGSVRLNDNIHAKMLIIDEREVLITTANLSQTGLYENYEVGVYADNPDLAKRAKEFFELVWNSEDTIELNEETLNAKVAWALIMDIKSRKEVEK
ncbi:PLD-like domain [Geoglobus ahangari]|uniref:PLD-like domain n=1 Tax=Geoglobus ahangari TaxID=113653 RepID=A0A0F7IES6_9EURY|nr:PLD-like domain [Geoglobus ahangari]